jgi:hypothetical protein
MQQKGKSLAKCHPPEWCIKQVVARGQWHGIAAIEGVVESPVMLADGSILQKPGYDPASGLYVHLEGDWPSIPDEPSGVDVTKARNDLFEIVEDFPFEGEEYKAAWLAAALTPAAWYAFDRGSPFFGVDANTRGTGKSLLVDAIATLHTGRPAARTSAPKDDEEARKRITSIALAGEPLVLIDNASMTIGWPALDAALTATTWNDRLLGKNEMTGHIPMATTWFVTGNNLVFAADTARRTLHIRLELTVERPEEREGFKHPDLLRWIRQERRRLVVAALTILRGYHVAGRPKAAIAPWGSFEGWSDLVRQAVVWLGLDDPGNTRQQLAEQSDREAGILRQLVLGWEEVDELSSGLTVAAALEKLNQYPARYATLRAAVSEMTPPEKPPSPRSIGMKMHHLRRRVVGGKRIDRRGDERGTAVWMVESVCGTNGTSGTNSLSYAGESEVCF